jgi:hypothetical protein
MDSIQDNTGYLVSSNIAQIELRDSTFALLKVEGKNDSSFQIEVKM